MIDENLRPNGPKIEIVRRQGNRLLNRTQRRIGQVQFPKSGRDFREARRLEDARSVRFRDVILQRLFRLPGAASLTEKPGQFDRGGLAFPAGQQFAPLSAE